MRLGLKGCAALPAGAKTYPTATGGSNTVIVLEAVDVEALKKAWKERR